MKRLLPFLLVVGLAACTLGQPDSTQAPGPTGPAASPSADETEAPSPTPEPDYAARVNGEGIRLDVYEAHRTQFEAALAEFGTRLAPGETASGRALASLIDQTLLAQAARAAGFAADEALLDEHLAAMTEGAGGQEALEAWAAENGYTAASLRADLKIQIEAAWMRDQLAAGVPESAEQVLARQVFTFDAFSAARLYGQLESGVPFQQVVDNNDPQNLGYIGWFPRGYLIFPALEEAAFALQPGQYSEVIQTEAGYHIVEVLAREPARSLEPDARLTLQERAVAAWLETARAQSQIEIYVP
ncbi:MAG: peptidylprolyl isomerase [Chloroflexi bacterium]|nr:peptidylprolyl isomerase [Chloroflexota bacterium]